MSTFIERLSFAADADYSPIEAAIHTGRYLLAKPYCRDRRVLDISCGEGYGSYILAEHWGAAHVDALDVSPEAIERAKATFPSERIRWHCADAEEASTLLEAASYDLIVSLETIEHLQHPERFLEQLRRLLKPDGLIVLSCPNDHWYYPDGRNGNPYHLHTFTFEEFRALSEATLGAAAQFMLGMPVSGFGNFPLETVEAGQTAATATVRLLNQDPRAITVPPGDAIDARNCAYFVGIWGPLPRPADISSSLFAQAMDGGLYATLDALRAAQSEARHLLTEAARALSETTERLESATAERTAAREDAQQLAAELADACATRDQTAQALSDLGMELTSTRNRLAIRTAEYEYGQLELRRAQAELAVARDRLALLRNPVRWLAKKAYHKVRNKAKNVPLLRKIYHRVKHQARQIPVLRTVYRKLKAIKQKLA